MECWLTVELDNSRESSTVHAEEIVLGVDPEHVGWLADLLVHATIGIRLLVADSEAVGEGAVEEDDSIGILATATSRASNVWRLPKILASKPVVERLKLLVGVELDRDRAA